MRIGNAAFDQFQLDVFGEFAATVYDGVKYLERSGLPLARSSCRWPTTSPKNG